MKKLILIAVYRFKMLISKARKDTGVYAKKQTPKQIAVNIALLIEKKFHNWVTADEVFDKFKKEFGTVEHTLNVLQTCVYYKVAVVKQLPDQRPRFKLCNEAQLRAFVLDEVIFDYEFLLKNLKDERKKYKNIKPEETNGNK